MRDQGSEISVQEAVVVVPEEIIRSTMTAMVTIIMGRNEATRADVENYTMQWNGELLRGTDSAQRVLIESLTQNDAGWIEYLGKGENRKVAISMDVALNDDLTAELARDERGERVHDALRRIVDAAPVFEPEPTGEHRIIDIREEDKKYNSVS